MKEFISSQIRASISVKEAFLEDELRTEALRRLCDTIVKAYKGGHKTLWAGNGGSAADAQHMAAELVNKFRFERPGLPAIALTTDSSVLTSIGNDYGFDRVFSRQIEALGKEGDVFIAISTSGNSENLVKAAETCREMGITSSAIVGETPCRLDSCDIVIKVPSADTPRIQECQELVGHILCSVIEKCLFEVQK